MEVLIHRDPLEIRERIACTHPNAKHQEKTEAHEQLQEYFRAERQVFSLTLDFGALPPFTRQVLLFLSEVPFGRTITYGELAACCGRPGAARAVGRAMAVNPLPIIVPCHRVVGAGGRLTGYSGGEGIATKILLLDFERQQTSGGLPKEAKRSSIREKSLTCISPIC